MISGIINVYKEAGFTSHDVVAKLRGIFHQKKIGHTGTLDPEATGVLPVCLGKATRVCDLLTDKDKTYRCVMRLGITTDTQDMTGQVLKEQEVAASEQEIREAVLRFQGDYDQIPPMYSARKVGGKKLYELARAGKEVERPPRRVKILELKIKSINLPKVTMEITCSKGTYIRTLCHDIGENLGCGACMESLIRTRVGDFSIEGSKTLSQLEQAVKEGNARGLIQSVDVVFLQYPMAFVKKSAQKLLENGSRLPLGSLEEWNEEWKKTRIRLYDSRGRFVGLYCYTAETKDLKPLKIFLEKD